MKNVNSHLVFDDLIHMTECPGATGVKNHSLDFGLGSATGFQ